MGTVAKNIAFRLPKRWARQFRRACQSGAAGLSDKLPDKYDTIIGDNGRQLSGDEMQHNFSALF